MNGKSERVGDDFVRSRVILLCDIFGKRCGDGLPSAVYEHLRGFSQNTVLRAFKRAEAEIDKFPTIKKLWELCYEESPSEMWTRDYRSAVGRDNETGKMVNILIDPATGEEMFYAQDCKEGREFLAKLNQMCGRHAIPQEPEATV